MAIKNDPAAEKSANADTWELIQALVLGRVPSDRILELFYLSQQSGLLEMARAIESLPPESRADLSAFLAVAKANLVMTEVEPSGRLVLTSPDITSAETVFKEIEKNTVDTPSYVRKIAARKV